MSLIYSSEIWIRKYLNHMIKIKILSQKYIYIDKSVLFSKTILNYQVKIVSLSEKEIDISNGHL